MFSFAQKLPIDSLIPQLLSDLSKNSCFIVQATPGAGKTTRIPIAIAQETNKMVLVLEPRRLAARLSAERVSEEIGESCGNTIGYQVRFDKVESENTKVKYITEGIFSRLILQDPKLKNIDCVVIDEFHERHIHSDIALMLVRLLQNTLRPDLKLIVMSATLEMQSLQNFLPAAQSYICEGKNFPVEIEYLPVQWLNKPLAQKVYIALESLLKGHKCPKDILVFLPGIYEIRLCESEVSNLVQKYNCILFQLRADLPIQEQKRVFQKASKRKIILATNVAETSLTIEGVTGVIDSGLAKIAGHASWSGLKTLELKNISQSSCIQRAGRAGRTQAGIAVRLYSSLDYQMRPAFEKPEIQRVDLAQSLLEIKYIEHKLKKESISYHLNWFDTPALNLYENAEGLLKKLGALNKDSSLTDLGKKMAQLPLHPRLALVLCKAMEWNVLNQILVVVSLINEGMLFKKNNNATEIEMSDISFQFEIFKNLFLNKEIHKKIIENIDPQAYKRIQKSFQHFAQFFQLKCKDCLGQIDYEILSKLLLYAYPDRVAQLRSSQAKNNNQSKKELNLCLGGGAYLSASSVVQDSEWLIAIEAEENPQTTSQAYSTQIRVCHSIESHILLEDPASLLKESTEFNFDTEKKIVRGFHRTLYGKLILDEHAIKSQSDCHELILFKELKAQWPKPFENEDAILFLRAKLNLALQIGLTVNCSRFIGEDFEMLLNHICEGKKSFAEVAQKDLDEYINELISYETKCTLEENFPKYCIIGNGRKVKIHYEDGKSPWIESRIQDFFGTLKTPHIAKQKIPLVVHLLAPNKRAVQVTADLEGFWERGYKEVKKELQRRYPKHKWPDDPKNAEPPAIQARRI